jgi:hypothetical protein
MANYQPKILEIEPRMKHGINTEGKGSRRTAYFEAGQRNGNTGESLTK